MKRIISIVSSAALVMTGALSLSMTVSADTHTEDIYGADNNNNHTSIYYDKTSKELYMSGYDYWHSGDHGGWKYWYYKINDKNKYEQQMRIARSGGRDDPSRNKYFKDLKESTEQEFEEALYQYEKNDKLTKVDIDKGFSQVEPTDYSKKDVDIPDYSYIRNISLDTQENTSVILEPKIMLYGTGIDLKTTWKSSDSKIAEVDSEGRVTAKAEGSCTVTSEIEGIGTVESYNITVEPYMSETEKKIKNIVDQGGTERDIYESIYSGIDGISSAGHVILDVDGDGKYELITRNYDRSAIMIYKLSGYNLLEKKFDYPDLGYDRIRMDMRYKDDDVYFTAMGTNDNKNYLIKVFKFSDSQFVMNKVYETKFSYDDYYLKIDASANKYLVCSWLESFNDNCTEATPSNTQLLAKSDLGSCLTNFMASYYVNEDSDEQWNKNFVSDDGAHGLYKALFCDEIYARHGLKTSIPRKVAFFNKKTYYKPEYDLTHFTDAVVDSEFSYEEREAIKVFNNVDNPTGQA